ncbi:MAG TPA: LLM class flavin-dependent oxidoreductase [Hyphomicrobiaceae bacterium]|nr:LLM class flavin-dependent oxidoreductase [Hyphomicrobiaceae bacterium]
MPVRIIGMIGVTPPASSATVHVIEGGLSAAYLRDFCRAHEDAGFDLVLVGYTSASAEGFGVATYASQHTTRLGFLIAHRPGLVSPSLAARKIATLDHLCEGRLAIHIIAGLSDAEQQSEGDFLPKPERYARAREYLKLIRQLWSSERPFDFEGKYYRVRKGYTEIKPYQKPHPLLFFGGSSAEALEMGAEQCDIFAMYGEPLAETAERIADYRRRTAALGRKAAFNMSFRPIIAETEGAAWDKARRILSDIKGAPPIVPSSDASGRRLLEIAAKGEIHDERFWTPIAQATGARGNTTCLVGTPKQVADAILKYYSLGIHSFLIRGFDPLNDAREYGRELIPRIRAGAEVIDRRAAAE